MMNRERRKQIQKVIEKIDSIQSEIEVIRDDEQDYLDNIPENLQGSERYGNSEAAIENLDSAIDSIEELINNLSESAV